MPSGTVKAQSLSSGTLIMYASFCFWKRIPSESVPLVLHEWIEAFCHSWNNTIAGAISFHHPICQMAKDNQHFINTQFDPNKPELTKHHNITLKNFHCKILPKVKNSSSQHQLLFFHFNLCISVFNFRSVVLKTVSDHKRQIKN